MAKKNANPPVKSKTNVPVQKTGSPSTIHHPLVHEATIGNRRRWAAWQDWLSVLLGIYLALAYLWIPGAPTALWVTLGVLVTVASLWAGTTACSTLAEFVHMVPGVLVFLSALFAAHVDERTAMLTSWMVRAALLILAVIASYRNRSGRSATNPHEYQLA